MRRTLPLILTLLLILPMLAPASPSLSAQILARLAERGDAIQDMTASVNFQVKVVNWGLAFHTAGTLYYKKPDKVRLKLSGVPALLAAHKDDLFRSSDVMAGLPRHITSEYHVVKLMKRHGDFVMELVPNEKRNVSKVYAWVDTSNYTLPQVVFQYHDGSSVRLWNQYVLYHNLYLVKEAHTIYTMSNPGMEADVHATFDNFKVNQGIPDAIFQTGKG